MTKDEDMIKLIYAQARLILLFETKKKKWCCYIEEVEHARAGAMLTIVVTARVEGSIGELYAGGGKISMQVFEGQMMRSRKM